MATQYLLGVINPGGSCVYAVENFFLPSMEVDFIRCALQHRQDLVLPTVDFGSYKTC